MVLREDDIATEIVDSAGGRSLSISGQESVPRFTAEKIAKQREDFLGMMGQFIPVIFETKTYLNGFYKVQGLSGNIEDWRYGMRIFPWSLDLSRIGTISEVDVESRFSGSITRQNNFATIGERIHAPSIGHSAYWSDATITSSFNRVTPEGPIKIYRGVGAEISPRWTVAPEDYSKGRVKFFDQDGDERSGINFKCDATDWELENGIVRIRPLSSGGVLEISSWSGTAWDVKNWDVLSGGTTFGNLSQCTVIDNQFESVTIRLMEAMTNGIGYIDLTLRRGFRIVEVYVQTEFAATMKIVRATAEAGTNGLGGTVVANANDGDGNKYIIGSARTFTADIVNGGIEKAAAVFMDAYIGVVFDGSSAQVGDAAADLQKQYTGAPSEWTQGVQR
jgi:hypothetical protein